MVRIPVDKGLVDRPVEDSLLLWCARSRLSADQSVRLRQLVAQSVIDWEQIVQRAEQHKMLPLLFWHVNQICPELVLPPILERLQSSFQANSWHTLFFTEECLRILQLFEQHQIRAVPLKGPVLAKILYDNPVLRVFDDLDILIRESDMPQAGSLLVDAGFTLLSAADIGYHTRFVAADRRTIIELHWRLTRPDLSRVSAADMLQRAQLSMFAETPIRQLDPVDLLIFLCLHGAKHQWYQLRWISDIAAYMHTYTELDWEGVMLVAVRMGHARAVLLGLYLAHQLLEAPLPNNVKHSINTTPIIREMAQRIEANLFQDVFNTDVQIVRNNIDIQVIDCKYTRVRLFFKQFIKDIQPKRVDYQLLDLPQPLVCLYYPLRLLRLIRFYRWLILKRFIRNIRSIR